MRTEPKPNDDLIVVQQGEILAWLGEAIDGIAWIRKAMRLSPYLPERFWFHLARAHFVARQYADAITALRHISAPDVLHCALLAACHARLDDMSQSQSQVSLVLQRNPAFSIAAHCEPLLHYRNDADRRHHCESLRLAGLPDENPDRPQVEPTRSSRSPPHLSSRTRGANSDG